MDFQSDALSHVVLFLSLVACLFCGVSGVYPAKETEAD